MITALAMTLTSFEKTARELSPLQQKFVDFFLRKLEEYGVDSPSKLSVEQKSKFFSEIKEQWPDEKAS